MSDHSTAELVAFGRVLGLREEWLQYAGSAREHFDLPAEVRERAIELGAVPVSPKELVRCCVRRLR